MCGERETPHHHHDEPEGTTPRVSHSRLDSALAKLARRRMMLGLQPPRPATVRPSMHTLEPRFLMAGDVVYALNAGGVDFTDVNGIAWVNDTAFTNQDAANSSTASTSSLIDRNHPSVPLGTDLQLLQTERYDAATGEPMAYRLAVDNGSYQVDLYFADTFSGTQGVGDRVFDIQLEGVTVADDFDVVAAAGGGYRAYVETFTVAVSDGILDLEFFHEIENPAIKGVLVRTVDIDPPEPVAPVVDLNGPAVGNDHAATFTPGQGPVPVTTSDALLSDADSTELASLTVSLDATPDGIDESLSADTTGTGLTAAYLNGTLTITGVGTVAEYQNVLRSVAYDNTATDPDAADRTITVVASDGALDSTPVTSTIAINLTPPDPIAPVLDLNGSAAGTGSTATFVPGEGPVAIADLSATLTDADSTTIQSLVVTLTNRPDGAAETLTADIANFPALAQSFVDGVLTISGEAPVADYADVLNLIGYSNTAADPDPTDRTITVVANDGTLDSAAATSTVTIQTAPPDPVAPVLDLNGLNAGVNTTATFVVGEGPVSIVPPEALLTDGDSATLQSITVKIDPVPADAQQSLAADTTGTPITATYSSGKLTLTGTATVAEYQSVLRTITYDNASSDPDLTPRVVTFVASDGVLSSIGASAIVQIQNPVVEAGSVVYALNAGGNSFTDANGVEWIADTPFTNEAAAVSFGFSNGAALDLSDPSVPANTAQLLLQSERWDSPGGEEMAYALDVANGNYQVDLYFADIFSGTQSVGARVFDVQLEDATVLDDYDIFADVGGFTGVVQTFNVEVLDGVLDITFLHETENPAVKGILVRTLDAVVPDPVAPALDLDAVATGTDSTATYVAGSGPVNVAALDATLTDADSATLESLDVFLVNTPDGAAERLDADVTGTGLTKSFAGGVLSLTGVASVAEYQAVLRTVTYDNLAATPDLAVRSINVIANDGTLDSNTAVATVTVEENTQAQPGTLTANVISALDFNNAQTGVVERITVTLTHPGAAIDDPVVVTGTSYSGLNPGDFGDLFESTYGDSVTVNPGESIDLVFYVLPGTTSSKFANVEILHSGTNTLSFDLEANAIDPVAVGFGTGLVAGLDAVTPTTLQWGPDDRLYVGTLDGLIHAYTITRNGPNDYAVTDTETITLVQDIPNHNDDGVLDPTVNTRLITGLTLAGTSSDPILYVTSSDPRLTNDGGEDIDTNSGIVSKLTQNAGGGWDKVDLVRGLPRSTVDHAPHAVQLLEESNALLVAVGGLTNAGAPGEFFGNLPEYALSAGIVSIDLDAIEALPTQTDANGQQFKYNLPTLDDEDRLGSTDANDPFGGNEGKNQAVLAENGPVDIFASGLRNPYDFVITQYGLIYSTDNGPNASIGDVPLLDENGQPTNEPNQGGSSAKDALHLVSEGSYSGHPNPTRANLNNTFNDTNPQSPVYNGYTEPGTYQQNGTDGALALFDTSTNGITEYTGTGFDGALNGDLLTVTIDGKLTRLKLSPDGTSIIDREILFNNSGVYPLDLTTVGEDHPFAGTIWVADLFAGPGEAVRVYEPEAGSGQGTPEDLDGDGYLNQDEIDNGTNPESSGDTPADNDSDFVSDLNDPDDDNDTLVDLNDPFQVDDTNGNNTNAPFALTFDNDDLNRGGLLDLGFTGVMTNGTTNYLDQFDFANLTAGSAAGVLTIDEVSAGTALGSANNQENAFQFGLNLNETSQPITIQTKIDSVFDNATPAAGQRAGLYFGTGDQDNYIAVFVEGDGTINTVTEIDGNFAFGTGDIVGDNFTNLNLYLTVDPTTQTVQAGYSYDNGPIVELAGTTSFPVEWLQATTAPAIGVIATNGGGESYAVTYDFIRVEFAGGNDGQAPFNGTPNQVGERVEAEDFDLGGENVAYLDLSPLNEGPANPRPGELVDFEPTSDAGGGINVGWIEAGEWLEYTFDIEEAGTYSADFRVALESGTGSTFHLEINGENISGPINLPVTGGWQNWQTVTATDLQLEAGPVVLRVAFDTASVGRFVGNFNWLQLNADDPNQNNGLDLGDSNEFNWVDAPPIPGGDRFEGMSITVDNIVYAFGGFSDGVQDKLVDVWAYDIASNQWSARTSMPAVVNHLNAVYDEATGLAWFVGGYKGDFPGQATDEVWVYDVANDSWSAGPALPEARSSGNLAKVGRTLHLIGGFPDRTSDAALTHYTLDLDNPSAGWSLLGVSSPASRGHASTAVLGTDIYILGGQIAHDTNTTDQDDVYKFDTVTQTWSQVADLPFGWSHAEPSTFTANGRIFMAGGRSNVTGRGQIDDFYMYDPELDVWVQLPDLPDTLLGPIFAVVDDPSNSPGGGHGPGCGCHSCQALFGTTGAFNGLDGTSNSFAADFDDVWSGLPNLPAELGEVAAGVIDNTLYVVGDGDDGTYAYDFTTSQWSSGLAQRPVPAKDQIAEVIDGKLYVFGGIDYAGGRQTFNDTQIYDPATDTWTTGTDVPINIFAAQTTVIDGKIYLSGGVDNSDQTTNATYVYDPADGPGGSWTQLADAPLFRNSAAVGTDGEKMYIFGGRFGGDAPGNGFTSVMIYDPATDTWESSEDPAPGSSTLAELPQARGGIVNAPFIDGEFYVIGGETDNDPAANANGLFDRVDIYDPVTNTWREGAPMLTPRHGIYPVAHAGAIYIPGGGVVKGASNSNVFDVYYPNLI